MANYGFPATFFQLGFIPLLIGLTGCSGVSAVRDVQVNPHRNWLTSTVYLKGTVSDRVPLINAQVYQLQDSTGTIWVLTNKATPKTGDRVYIKGQVRYEKIPIEGQDFGEAYIEEQEQLDPDPPKNRLSNDPSSNNPSCCGDRYSLPERPVSNAAPRQYPNYRLSGTLGVLWWTFRPR